MSGEAYVKRYGAGGFVDLPAQTTSIDSQFLNGVEAALARLLGADPTDKFVQVWDAGLGRFKTVLLTAANLDPAAGILKSQLAPLAITDADVAAGANIAASKLGGNIPVSKLQLSATTRQILSGSGTYTLPAGCRAILVEAIGGGGAGGGVPATGAATAAAGGGGGGGSYASLLIAAPAATYAYVCGAGGTGVSNANGNNGGATSFGGALVGAGGGGGGSLSPAQTPPAFGGARGTVGVPTAGEYLLAGLAGLYGEVLGNTQAIGGAGGAAARGGGGGLQTNVVGNGSGAPLASGGGGGGAGALAVISSAAAAGGAGAAGSIVVTEYY